MGMLNDYANAAAVNAALNEGVEASKAVSELKEDLNELSVVLELEQGTEEVEYINGDEVVNSLSVNPTSYAVVSSSMVKSVICDVSNAPRELTLSKIKTSRFIVAQCANQPTSGTIAIAYNDFGVDTEKTLTINDDIKYLLIIFYHSNNDASIGIETAKASLSVKGNVIGGEYVSRRINNIEESIRHFNSPLSLMPNYITNLLSYRPLGQLTKGYICLSCDDGTENLVNYTIPLLNSYKETYGVNVPVTFGLMKTSASVTDVAKLSVVKNAVENLGCSVAVHGITNYTDFANEEELSDEINGQIEYLTSVGLVPSAIIYPQHHYNKMICAVAGGYYGVCCTGGSYTDLTYGSGYCAGARSNMYSLYRLSLLGSSMTVAKVREYIDYAYENHLILLPFWHDDSLEAKHDLLDECVRYAVEKGIGFITIGDIPKVV